jgi:predicted dehydrogenase
MSELNIAVIGASKRSSMIFDYLVQNPKEGTVIGVFDIIPAVSQKLIEQHNAPQVRVYSSLSEAVEDENVDAVFIGTPDSEHVEPVTAALRAGKHVYVEKPMAITLEDCDVIINAAKDAKKIFYLGMNLRHGPVHEKLHEVLNEGQLGKLLTIEANEYYHGGKTYFRRWNRLRKLGGGLWITKACHDFDLLNWFSGGQPTRVFATSSLSYYKPKPEASTHCRDCPLKDECRDCYDIENPEASGWTKKFDELGQLVEEASGKPRDLCLFNSDKDTFDNGIAVVDYDNDVRATYTVNVVSARDTRQMRLMGTEGSAEGDMAEGTVAVWKRYTGEKTVYDLKDKMASSHGGADDQILADFFECCRTGKNPRSSWSDGRLSLKVGLGARESCDTGHVVELKK